MDSKEGRPPSIIGFYNQLKQEFVSARWLLFEALQGDESHFSDKDVLLYNTLEYPMYGLSVEKMRSAYRVAYSLLDKTAYFLNHYFALGHPDRTVNFRNVWYQPKTMGQKVLHDELAGRENWPLRGLFWLSKDIFEPDIKGVTEPDAQALYDIRNHLEHKYLQVVETVFESLVPVPDGEHVLGYRISWADFRSKTTRIFKLARASLIYLSLAVHKEEKRREQERSAHTVMPMPLATWSDEWKQ